MCGRTGPAPAQASTRGGGTRIHRSVRPTRRFLDGERRWGRPDSWRGRLRTRIFPVPSLFIQPMSENPQKPQATAGYSVDCSHAIDRMTPSRRPAQRAVMRQSWRDLMFLHWPVSPALIRPMIPEELELDLFEGTAFVGLVPFTMCGIRPVGLPAVPGLSRFHETNVRTYVHFQGRDPGVWFFSLDAASRIAVQVARWWFHLPYYHAEMAVLHQRLEVDGQEEEILYMGVRHRFGPPTASYVIRGQVHGEVTMAVPGTLEHFLVERYILYTQWKARLYQGWVHHRAYPLRTATVSTVDESLLAAAGFVRPATSPLAHFSTGVDVEIFPLRELR